MAIEKVTESWEGLDTDAGADGAEATRLFDVTFDSDTPPARRPLDAWSATDGTTTVPQLYSPHPHKSQLFVRNKRVEPQGPFHFQVYVYYTTQQISPAGESQSDPFADPLAKPWEVEWGFVATNEPIDRDIHGNPIRNSIGETFDPPIMREFSDLLLTIRRNEADFNYARAADYKDAVNDDFFYGFAPGCVRCVNYSGRRAFTGVIFYWQVTYAFHIRRGSWLRRILDEGYKTKKMVEDVEKTVKIEDDEGNIVSQPWPLNGNGYRVESELINLLWAFWLEFEIYHLLPFSVLGL